MTLRPEQLMVDTSVILKWKITSEDHFVQADDMLLDSEYGIIDLCVCDQVLPEIMNACLKVYRKEQVTENQAQTMLDELLAYPFKMFKTTRRVLRRAFEIAKQENQRGYDCIHVALAERKRMEFWTGDQRLFNALHERFPFLRWIGDYQRKRPES